MKHITLTTFIVLAAFTGVFGQSAAALKPGSSAGSFALSGFENINPYSGSLNFNLPLVEVGGRGSSNIPITLNISQKWRGAFWYPDPNEPTGIPYVRDNFDSSDFYNYDMPSPGIVLLNRMPGTPQQGCYGQSSYLYSLTTVTFRAPDGTDYQFRDRATNGQWTQLSTCQSNPPSRGTIFDSMDGSGATYIADETIYDQIYPGGPSFDLAPSGYIILTDGTKYGVGSDGSASWKMDRNGNKTTYGWSGSTFIVTDSMNRQITYEFDVQDSSPYGLCNRITYKGFGGADRVIRVSRKNLTDVLRSGFSIQTRAQLFPDIGYATGSGCNYSPGNGGCGDYTTNPVKPSAVWLPDGRSYKFKYNSHAELARVELPTGGAIEYDWVNGYSSGSGLIFGAIPLSSYNTNNYGRFDIYRRVSERRVYSDGTNLDNKLVIGPVEYISGNTGYVTESLYSGSSTLVNKTKHYYYGISNTAFESVSAGYEAWISGREYQTDILDSDGTTLLRRSTNTWTQSSPSWYSGNADYAPINNPHVTETTTKLADSNQVSKKTFTYDSKGNLTDTYEYDYGTGAPGSFLRRSHTDYLTTNSVNSTNYTSDAVHIYNLPSQSWVSSDSSGNTKVSLTVNEYDNYASDSTHAALENCPSISGHDSAFTTSYTTRGNLTKSTSYASAANQTGGVSAYLQYDIAGNVVEAIDAKNNHSTVDYSDRFGSPSNEAQSNTAPSALSGLSTFAYPTSGTNAVQWTTGYVQRDFYTGAVVDAEDMNGNISTTHYDDVLDRPTQTISNNNRSSLGLRSQATVVYDDSLSNRKVTVTADSKTYNDNLIKAVSYYDGLGRTTENRNYEDATNYIKTLTEYDNLGRAYKSSNPFRAYLSETAQYTTSSYDALGRVIEIKTPDNATVTRSYYGSSVTVTDQASNSRSGSSDAIGRLLKVTEFDGSTQYDSLYTYDVLGRLRKTAQTSGGTTQNRYFMYNDLGRLIRAKQVEQTGNSSLNTTDPITSNGSWSVGYAYDDNGNISTATDSRNITITGTYDSLNRLTFRNYSDSTPDVTFTYDDTNIANSKGHLTKVASSVSTTNYTAFDILGRIKSSSQTTGSETYTMPDYSYDLSGALVSQTYPSGRVVSTETDAIGRLSRVASQLPNNVQKTMLSQIGYTSFGAVKQAKLGNGKWESAQFDNQRLQITQIGLGGSAGDTSLLKIEYGYGSSSTNNVSLKQQKITVPGASHPIIQDYTYDHLNRLFSATETVNSTQTWKQTFSYDRFGNRRFDPNNTTTLPANNGTYNPNIDLPTNQFPTSDGYSYDSEGNLIANPESQSLSYDAENHLIQVQNSATQTTANYSYDGQGKRVKNTVGTQETIFVYDAFGKVLSEYTLNQTITQNGAQYLTADALGSPRVITSAIGQVASRHDYMPFGEEVASGVGGRTTTQGYAQADNARQKFTGYERDTESGLDFAQARYFVGKHGRFTSTDPTIASARLDDPQTLNRYSYVFNKPLNLTDPSGKCPPVDDNPCKEGDRWELPEGEVLIWTKNVGKNEDGWLDKNPILISKTSANCDSGAPCANTDPPSSSSSGRGIGEAITAVIIGGAGTAGTTAAGGAGGTAAIFGGTAAGGGSSGGSGGSGGEKTPAQIQAEIQKKIVANDSKIAQINLEIKNSLGIFDGLTVSEDEILDLAEDFLEDSSGRGPYIEDARTSGRYISADGTRVVRMTSGDLTGHGGRDRPHFNFEIFTPNPMTGKMTRIANDHVYFY